MQSFRHSHRHTLAIVILCMIVIASIGIYAFSKSRFNITPNLIGSITASTAKTPFPQIDSSGLSETQQQIITQLRTEYAAKPAGTKYSEGVDEPWCADFVSWIMDQAGVPFTNPNSGSWRIPGTYTLREYYESAGRFKAAASEYSPKVGDIMLYDNPSPFGQHTNIVIKNDSGIITTIGGNEPGGIRVFKHTQKDGAGFIGYGVL
jgi:hypothetical protein